MIKNKLEVFPNLLEVHMSVNKKKSGVGGHLWEVPLQSDVIINS